MCQADFWWQDPPVSEVSFDKHSVKWLKVPVVDFLVFTLSSLRFGS